MFRARGLKCRELEKGSHMTEPGGQCLWGGPRQAEDAAAFKGLQSHVRAELPAQLPGCKGQHTAGITFGSPELQSLCMVSAPIRILGDHQLMGT